jgi:hypothetical protein
MLSRSRQRGQASVELVAAVPILLCVVLALGQAAVAGYALWSAASAARVGARAALVDGDIEGAALSAVPDWLERDVRVEGSGPVEVALSAPSLLPGLPSIPVEAAASLGEEDGA